MPKIDRENVSFSLWNLHGLAMLLLLKRPQVCPKAVPIRWPIGGPRIKELIYDAITERLTNIGSMAIGVFEIYCRTAMFRLLSRRVNKSSD